MSEPLVIDKYTYKLMRYIYFRDGVTHKKLIKKYGSKGMAVIVYLFNSQYIANELSDYEFSFDTPSKNDNHVLKLTIRGNAFVENHLSSTFQWLMATSISILALIISVLTLVL